LAVAETDVNKLVNKYQAVIDKYALTYIDIDIEGSAVGNKQSVDRRSQALKIIKERNQNLILSYTVATTPNGLPNDVLYLINSAKNYGLKLDGIDFFNVSGKYYGYGLW
jgi:chitinase